MVGSPSRDACQVTVRGGSSARTTGASFSVAAPQSEGPHLTLRHGPARPVYSGYTHYCPRRADGMAGALLRCISPLCCSNYLPQDRSATTDNLCTYPSRMRPLQTPLAHRTPQNATSGRGTPACCREGFLPYQPPFPPDLESSTVTIFFRQHPYLRCRLTGTDDLMTGLWLTTWRATALVEAQVQRRPASP
jgi:hypothetical protein